MSQMEQNNLYNSSVAWSSPEFKGHLLQGDTRNSGPGEVRRAHFQGGLMCCAALKCTQMSVQQPSLQILPCYSQEHI